ncbi:CGNR zinc finger domain-containing protein [Kitasatospora sp. NPDC004240]
MSIQTADPRDPRPLIGEPLALDLLNTRWTGTPVNDLLTGTDGLAVWLSSAGLAARAPATEAALAAVLEAREAVGAVVRALEEGGVPGADERAALNALLGHGRLRRELGPAGRTDHVEPDDPRWLAPWLVADDLLGLLEQGAHRIKRCAGHGCILHFFDTSQNGRRRWCSMAGCGNRAKAARHYAKAKA